MGEVKKIVIDKSKKKKFDGPTKSKDELMNEFATKMADMVLENLKTHSAIYNAGWEGGKDGLPFSLVRGTNYKGQNMFMLSLTAACKGYSSNGWLTFRDAKELGGNVKKGEHGTQIMRVIFDRVDEGIATDKDGRVITGPNGLPAHLVKTVFKGVKFFTVFNYDQCENLPPLTTFPSYMARQRNHHLPDDAFMAVAEELCDNAFVDVRWGGSEAFYTPGLDRVVLPDKDRFFSGAECFGTAAHELSHASGAKGRLDRDLLHYYGTPKYAYEECVAEFSASMLCAFLGCSKKLEQSSIAYISTWAQRMKEDPTVLTKEILPKATRACAFVAEKCGLEKIMEKHGFNVESGVDDPEVNADDGMGL